MLGDKNLVGVAGFEPTTTTPPVWCATRLRYTPILEILGASVENYQYKKLLTSPRKLDELMLLQFLRSAP